MPTNNSIRVIISLLLCTNQSWTLQNSRTVLQRLLATTCHIPKRFYCTNGSDKTDVPAPIKALLDAHTREIQALSAECSRQGIVVGGGGVRQVEWLPDWYIKYGIARYINAHIIKAFIAQNKLTLVSMANKFLYHIPHRSYDLSNDNYLVMAQKASGNHIAGWHLLNGQQMDQLIKVELQLEHSDMRPANFVVDHNGIITIVDTDELAMKLPKVKNKYLPII